MNYDKISTHTVCKMYIFIVLMFEHPNNHGYFDQN